MMNYGNPHAIEELLRDRDWRRAVAPDEVDGEDLERAARSGDLPGAPESVDRGRAVSSQAVVTTTHDGKDNRRSARWITRAADEVVKALGRRS